MTVLSNLHVAASVFLACVHNATVMIHGLAGMAPGFGKVCMQGVVTDPIVTCCD